MKKSGEPELDFVLALHCTALSPTQPRKKRGAPKFVLATLFSSSSSSSCGALRKTETASVFAGEEEREREREKERERERESLLPFYNACAHWSCTTTTVRSLHALLQPLSGATYFEQCCQLILKKNAQKHNALVFFSCSFFYVIRLPLFLSTTVRYFFGLFQVFIQ